MKVRTKGSKNFINCYGTFDILILLSLEVVSNADLENVLIEESQPPDEDLGRNFNFNFRNLCGMHF